MSTFKEFLNQQEQIDEGLRSNLAMGAAALGSMLGLGGNLGAQENYTKATGNQITQALINSTNPEAALSQFGKYDIHKISDKDVAYLLKNASDKERMEHVLQKYGRLPGRYKASKQYDNLDSSEVFNLLKNSDNPAHMASVLGEKNMQSLEPHQIHQLMENPLKFKKVLEKYNKGDLETHQKTKDENTPNPYEHSSPRYKQQIGMMAAQQLLTSENPDLTAKILGKHKIDLIPTQMILNLTTQIKDQKKRDQIIKIMKDYGRMDSAGNVNPTH